MFYKTISTYVALDGIEARLRNGTDGLVVLRTATFRLGWFNRVICDNADAKDILQDGMSHAGQIALPGGFRYIFIGQLHAPVEDEAIRGRLYSVLPLNRLRGVCTLLFERR